MKRRDAAALVASGTPVVTYWPGGLPEKTEVVWHDHEDATTAWAQAHGVVTHGPPQPRGRQAVVTAGSWESTDGATVLVLTWHH